MSQSMKKLFLIYFLFLLTTLDYSPKFAPQPPSADAAPSGKETAGESVQQPTLPVVDQLNKTKTDPPATAEKATGPESEPKLSGIEPAVIDIPAIGEQAEIINVGLTEDGAMEAPTSIYEIGWYAPGTKPGSAGNAVMAGHVDGLNSPGTFFNLKKLEKGDEIHITGTEGEQLTFVVTDKKSYTPEDAPLEKIFGASSGANLNLITCTGTFNADTGDYEERLVVYTELVKK
ncbi:class F sortase [Planomicrobium okeanokoites]|uniref:class F sortase n=1 Tax=Planomicrobium okeanokoites TaxID=244 RepID=UPI0035621216